MLQNNKRNIKEEQYMDKEVFKMFAERSDMQLKQEIYYTWQGDEERENQHKFEVLLYKSKEDVQ